MNSECYKKIKAMHRVCLTACHLHMSSSYTPFNHSINSTLMDNPLKNSQAVKNGMKNVGWRPRNGYDGRSVTKILITTIQVNLCCLIPGIGTKFT